MISVTTFFQSSNPNPNPKPNPTQIILLRPPVFMAPLQLIVNKHSLSIY